MFDRPSTCIVASSRHLVFVMLALCVCSFLSTPVSAAAAVPSSVNPEPSPVPEVDSDVEDDVPTPASTTTEAAAAVQQAAAQVQAVVQDLPLEQTPLELNPGMNGGNTYNGVSSEPTIQDYENIFGPSARDIKSDLQRFKRHGRWHLPDVLKGPNPWLTDRVDGLITDATNSPFTTKILPYLYKEDPDGKFTWNVWQFDEGMASRVPYESAARTLTQSKREFSGYMVRHGMAIVLEHNFMMSPKGRENFKNQLNQLIGSIQYSNDFDVHMALVLAPSYQKTMREKYFTLDKSPGQICREFCDLFGMMQKNVNALDILIEEAKAILKTWNGPMPDFLLCNSKLTFQLTMTPEKTNYMTQGADGTKRLRQGPDISSYRGLSVIHSRAFSLEVGKQPRDILRRRVRTAEYYRILPHKNNMKREFELYTEERDTWFTMTFQDLLRYAMHSNAQRHHHYVAAGSHGVAQGLLGARKGPYGIDNHRRLEEAYQETARGILMASDQFLGAPPSAGGARKSEEEQRFLTEQSNNLSDWKMKPFMSMFVRALEGVYNSDKARKLYWGFRYKAFDLGVRHIAPRGDLFPVWSEWREKVETVLKPPPSGEQSMICIGRLTQRMQEDLFFNMQNLTLNNPFIPGEQAAPMTPAWYTAYAFYQEVYRRGGIAKHYTELEVGSQALLNMYSSATEENGGHGELLAAFLSSLKFVPQKPDDFVDITYQTMDVLSVRGSVNHPLQFVGRSRLHEVALSRLEHKHFLGRVARRILLTYEVLEPLLKEYVLNGDVVTGLDYLCFHANGNTVSAEVAQRFADAILGVYGHGQDGDGASDVIYHSKTLLPYMIDSIYDALKGLQPYGSGGGGACLCRRGINNWPMTVSTVSHCLHPANPTESFQGIRGQLIELSASTHGFMNAECIQLLTETAGALGGLCLPQGLVGHELSRNIAPQNKEISRSDWKMLWQTLRERVFEEPFDIMYPTGVDPPSDGTRASVPFDLLVQCTNEILRCFAVKEPDEGRVTSVAADHVLNQVVINLNDLFDTGGRATKTLIPPAEKPGLSENVEIVIVRPNIEHNMLGIIMGLAGSELGYTLWGQTELSCYDDSMHGIWGMSYKYHERAIVFNERNLVRLWDIAYDGYNGGKDDTYVDWVDIDNPKNGLKAFCDATLDLSCSYRGPSMMVMAFVHDRDKLGEDGRTIFDTHFRRNWPSPIVFHDTYNPGRAAAPVNETLPLDYDNIQVLSVEDFRVFSNPLYAHSYGAYRDMMPAFHELHKMRKSAGQSSADAETHTDSLAFQGSMRIKEAGRLVQEIQGSGHHGPDYVGVASVRAGKGIKYTGQAPAFTHMV